MKNRRFRRIALVTCLLLALAHLVSVGFYRRPTHFETPDELDREDCRVGVIDGNDSEITARRRFPRAQFVAFRDPQAAFISLLAGRIEGFVHDEHVLAVGTRAYPHRLKILDGRMSSDPSVVLVSAKRPDLLKRLNAFIARGRKSGFLDDMYLRWCQSDVYVAMPKVVAAAHPTGELVIGTSGEEEPSTFVDDNGNLAGYDIEFALRFAQAEKLRPRFVCRSRAALAGELTEGKLDLVVDDCTPLRAQRGTLVSDGYFDADTKVLVKGGDDSKMMLGAERLGYAGRIFKDPRPALFFTGFGNTCALTFLSAALGILLARLVRALERRAPHAVQGFIDVTLAGIRWVPPPVILLVCCNALLSCCPPWLVALVTFTVWFAACIENVVGVGLVAMLPVLRIKLVDLLQWTSIVGSISVCDMTMAADLVCGRAFIAFGPMLSLAATYCLLSWLIVRTIAVIEHRLFFTRNNRRCVH